MCGLLSVYFVLPTTQLVTCNSLLLNQDWQCIQSNRTSSVERRCSLLLNITCRAYDCRIFATFCAKNRHFDFFANCQWHISNCKNADPPFPEIEFRGFRLFLCDESKFCPFRWHLIVIAKPTEPYVCVAKLTRGIFGNSFMRNPA